MRYAGTSRRLASQLAAPVLALLVVATSTLSPAQTAPASSSDASLTLSAPAAEAPVEDPPLQGTLTANVWNQTSAEYRACCRAIYAAAAYRLEALLEDASARPACPAVVMDLDETVLDVSSFQAFLYENGLEYTPVLWSVYEREGADDVELVPGAREFIERAEGLGVVVVYLSNRNEVTREHTVAAMERLGLDVTGIDARIYLKPTGASSDKSPRRDAIAAKYDVLMIFGDNLRDFSEIFAPERLGEDASAEDYRSAIEARADAVDDALCHWGVDWFVLPNCMYGEWEKLVPPDPMDIFRPTDMMVDDVIEDQR